MASYNIITPRNSFVRFDGDTPENHCIFGQQEWCLPVLEASDIAFQFIAEAATVEDADLLCTFAESGLAIGLYRNCLDVVPDVELTEQPERYRISPLQVLYVWPHGVPGFDTEYDLNECFYIKITVGDTSECSNCFQRIGNGCFTSVIEYGNDESSFGFAYCAGETVDGDQAGTCDPYIVEFFSKSTLAIPYTAGLKFLYGDFPTVQVWISDGTNLVNMGIQATFDAYPPTLINFDFGGTADGIIVIR